METVKDEIIVMWIEFFASVMGWSWIAALASLIIGGILFLFFNKTENTFLCVCTLVFMSISGVLLCVGSVAVVLMVIPAIPEILKQLEMYLR